MNEPIIKVEKLTQNQIIKKKVVIDNLMIIFNDNNWYFDILSYEKLQSQKYLFFVYSEKMRQYYDDENYNIEHEELFDKQRGKIINEKNNYALHESRTKNYIEKIIKKCFIYFERPYGTNNMIRTGLCGECMKKIYIDENLCYMCNSIFFEKCDNNHHEYSNINLPLKKRYSQDLIIHVYNCILNNKYFIDELYCDINIMQKN
jgi:hypothetical protein